MARIGVKENVGEMGNFEAKQTSVLYAVVLSVTKPSMTFKNLIVHKAMTPNQIINLKTQHCVSPPASAEEIKSNVDREAVIMVSTDPDLDSKNACALKNIEKGKD